MAEKEREPLAPPEAIERVARRGFGATDEELAQADDPNSEMCKVINAARKGGEEQTNGE